MSLESPRNGTPPIRTKSDEITYVPSQDDYETIKILGKGSFGDVNLAREKSTGRLVAVKALFIPHILKMNKRDAVVREGKILEVLRGKPYIIELITKFKEENQLFFIFERCKYGTLA
jgi:serine/threonine protein kinase